MVNLINGSFNTNLIYNEKSTIANAEKPKNSFDKSILKDFKGLSGLKKEYDFDKMTDTEKSQFNSYLLELMILPSKQHLKSGNKLTYEEFKKRMTTFPPPNAERNVFQAWESFLSKYTEDEQHKIMAQFSPIDKSEIVDIESYIQGRIEYSVLDQIVTGKNRDYERKLYNSFLKEFEKFKVKENK